MRNRIIQILLGSQEREIMEILALFPASDRIIAESTIADMIDEGKIKSFLTNNKTFLRATRDISIDISAENQEDTEIVVTLPEMMEHMSRKQVLSTRAVFQKLINESQGDLKVTEPFIDNSFIEIFLEEFRNAARRGVKLTLITRRVDSDSSSLKALLRLYEIFGINSGSTNSLEVYEHWTPLRRTRFDYSKQFIGLHSKIMLNQKEVYVGSANWTEYSLGNNIEFGLVVKNEIILSKLREMFSLLLTQARRVDMQKLRSIATRRS